MAAAVIDVEITGEEFDARFTEVISKQKNPQEVGYEVATARGLFPNATNV